LAAEIAIPRVNHPKRVHGVPLSGPVRRAFRRRKRVIRELKGSHSILAQDIRDKADQDLNDAIHDSRKKFELSIVEQSRINPKRFWSHAHTAFANKPKITSVMSSEGTLTNSDKDTADAFNDFFASVFSDSEIDLPAIPLPVSEQKLSTFAVSIDAIKRVFRSLPNHSSPGPDGISNILLKEGGHDLLLLVYNLFSLIISLGVLPTEWKTAEVVPIFKKGNRNDCKNYRPISLTCTLCKVFERLLKDVMLDFLMTNDLLNRSQHGFLPKRSCCSALLTFVEEVTSSISDNMAVDSVYLDFSKAFDSVPHKRLLLKLESMGFSGDIICLIRSFLSDRKQIVKIANCCSHSISVTSGVPQGSVLGPLLFVVFINDIDSGISSSLIKFADDIKLFQTFDPSEKVLLQNDLNTISQWCATWLLNLNVEKCACLHLGNNNPLTTYHINGINIANTNKVTDLGVVFTADLKPSSHCQRIVAKAHRIISTIKLAFKFLDPATLSILYKAFVRPILEYCSVAWCPYFVKDIESLEKVQRRMSRMLPCLRQLTYEQRLTKLRLQTLHTRRLRFDLITVYKILHGIIDIDPGTFFKLCVDQRTRGHKYKLATTYSRLNARKYSFSSRITPAWNALPAQCVEAPNLDAFKIELDKSLLSSGAL
jgi:ribonuclease P/MRP protein subunit RPP40